jgi:serine kinase of HPr protein (carbohydrate metabolism regulator)
MTSLHATCVAFGKIGVLIRGPSGSGKSSLALRLIDGEGFGLGRRKLRARLVADDQVVLSATGGKLRAGPPPALAGLIELRGLGLRNVPFLKSVAVRLVVDLAPHERIARLPEPAATRENLLGVSLPRIMVDPALPQAAALVRAALPAA